MSKHTPEPWAVDKSPCFGQWHIRQDPANWDGAGYQHICSTPADRKGTFYGEMFKANANRIVACVNYCAGMESHDLVAGGGMQALAIVGNERRISDQLNKYREQRDQLLAVLKEAKGQVEELCRAFSVPIPDASLTRYEDAIAAVEGSNQS